MLTPYDFFVIIGLKLSGERIHVNDSFTANEIKKLLGVVPSKMMSKNVPLLWLCENITKCDTVARVTCMFMLLFIETFLCPDLGSIMNLRYLWSLRNIEQIKNYDWGGMAYATLLHFMTQLSRCSLSSLGDAPFVWQVRFEILVMCEFWKVILAMYGNGVVKFFQVWMYEYFGVGPKIQEEVNDIFPRFLRWLPKHRLSTPSRRSLEIWRLVIDNLTTDDVSPFPFFLWDLWCLVVVWSFSHSGFIGDFLDVFKSLGWM